jgi:hypothetical protein
MANSSLSVSLGNYPPSMRGAVSLCSSFYRPAVMALALVGGSFMSEPVSIASIGRKGSKRALGRASGLFIPVVLLLMASMVGRASAATPAAPAWALQSLASPSSFPAGKNTLECEHEDGFARGCDHYTLVATNVGSRGTEGPITVVDTLPPGVTVIGKPRTESGSELMRWECTTEALAGHQVVRCISEFFGGAEGVPTLSAAAELNISVNVPATASGVLSNRVEVSGGGAAPTSAEVLTPVESPPPPFGLLGFTATAVDPTGAPATLAASHPGGFFTSFSFPTALSSFFGDLPRTRPVEEVKQIVAELPPGMVGDALAATTCPLYQVTNNEEGQALCPAASRVGKLALIEVGGSNTELTLFNVPPEQGYAAEFAAYLPELQRAELLYARLVGSGANAHVQVISAPHDAVVEEVGVSLTFFGEPGVLDGGSLTPVAFFTNPSDCGASGFTNTIYVGSWQHPARMLPDGQPDLSDPNWKAGTSQSPPVTGCEALQFHPTFSLTPDTTQADAPTGDSPVDLSVPQNEDSHGLATPPAKEIVVTAPLGVTLNPGAANGLVGCSPEQIDLASSTEPGNCPPASQVGTVEVKTPVLAAPLTGAIFVGQPGCGPCTVTDDLAGNLLKVYLEVGSTATGIHLKLQGTATADPSTGQLTVTFKDLPQQPFSDAVLTFNGGSHAVFINPLSCGRAMLSTRMTPWSSPFTPDATPSSAFNVDWDGAGGACPASLPFSPSFSAGTTRNTAAAFSPFALTFTRPDRNQPVAGVQVKLPPGALAKLSTVPQCAEAQAAQGSCPAVSAIGHVSVASGTGTDPLWLAGTVYLTGPYKGSPFGLSVVVPAVAGPFNLGNVVVRSAISVDPSTAQATVTSDPFPQIIDGIQTHIQTVNVTVDRPEFTFNASSCAPMKITGTLLSTTATTASLSAPYQAADCAALPFRPVLTASTNGLTSKRNGASLSVKIGSGGIGQANIAKVALTIPRALPSRLTTIQRACPESQFDSNPAGCAAASNIATAVVHTPLLANPLSGPVYFVSHGGAAFPDTEIILQGEGVQLILDGHTDIKKGVTYSRFESVPDAPFTSFEFKAPEGPFSIFSANGNLCGLKKTITVSKKQTRRVHGHTRTVTVMVKKMVPEALALQATITAQNGAVVNEAPKVAVTGCPAAKAAKKASATKAKGARRASSNRRARR